MSRNTRTGCSVLKVGANFSKRKSLKHELALARSRAGIKPDQKSAVRAIEEAIKAARRAAETAIQT